MHINKQHVHTCLCAHRQMFTQIHLSIVTAPTHTHTQSHLTSFGSHCGRVFFFSLPACWYLFCQLSKMTVGSCTNLSKTLQMLVQIFNILKLNLIYFLLIRMDRLEASMRRYILAINNSSLLGWVWKSCILSILSSDFKKESFHTYLLHYWRLKGLLSCNTNFGNWS